MGDLTNQKLICLKGFLFLFAGLASAILLLLDNPSLRVAFFLSVAIWSFARFYYFCFYVIEKYVDPEFKFAGIISAMRYLLAGKSGRSAGGDVDNA